MNSDSSPEKLEEGEGRFRLNVRVMSSDNDENDAAETTLGNTLVTYSLPAGTNKCIGAREYEKYGKAYSFIYNSNGDHRILEYDIASSAITLVLADNSAAPYLNFDIDHLITGIGIVELDANNWLLYWTDDYNEPKKINIQKAKFFSAGDYVNGYKFPFDGDITYAIKKPQMYPPTYTWSNDAAQLINYLFKKFFKVKVQFVYDDREVSSWSPESKYVLPITTNDGTTGEDILTQYNKMTIAVETGSSIVKKIRIAAKEVNEVDFKIIAELNKAELNIGDNTTYNFDFYNNGNYLILDPEESSKLFDSVPFLSKTLECIDGIRITYGNIVEGIDPVNIDMRLPVSYVPVDTNPNAHFPKVSYLKGGGSYKIGIAYFDGNGNRSGAVNVVNGKTTEMVYDRFGTSLFLPFITDPLCNPPHVAPMYGLDYVPKVGVEIYNAPPADTNITHYQIYRSKNESMDRYLWFAAQNILYLAPDKTTITATSGASFVRIDIANILGRYKEENPASKLVYSYVKGDRIRFIANNHWTTLTPTFGLLAPTGGNSNGYVPALPLSSSAIDPLFSFNDNEIMSYDSSTGSIYIKMTSLVPNNLLPGVLFEIYQPAENVIDNNEFMFEMGEVHPITTDIHGNRVHGGTANQLITTFATSTYVGTTFTAVVPTGHGLAIGNKVKITGLGYSVYGVVTVSGGTSVTISTVGYTLIGTFNGATPGTITKAAQFDLSGGDSFRRYQDMPFVAPGVNRLYMWVDAENASNMFDSKAWDVGRPNKIDPDYKRIRRETTVYFTEKFIPETNVNGLSTIYEPSFQPYNAQHGSIQHLLYENHRLIIFQELKVGQIPVQQIIYNDLQLNQTVGASSNVLSPDIVYYLGEFGIGRNPESLVIFAQAKYFIDIRRGVILRLSSDGLTPISITCKMHNYVTDVCRTMLATGIHPKIYGVYDAKFGEYIISFEGIPNASALVITPIFQSGSINSSVTVSVAGVIAITMASVYPVAISLADVVNYINSGTLPAGVTGTRIVTLSGLVASIESGDIVLRMGVTGIDRDVVFIMSTPVYNINIGKSSLSALYAGSSTLAFNEKENYFSTFYSYLPDFMCGANTDIITWKDGNLYSHNNNAVYNNFYGVQYRSRLWAVVNGAPSKKKVYQAISLEGSRPWNVTIETPVSEQDPFGQVSPLVAANFKTIEGFPYAAFKRDQNTPNKTLPIINGNPMRGQTALIKLDFADAIYNKLYAANVLFENSERSDK